jgi:hypothetical protein
VNLRVFLDASKKYGDLLPIRMFRCVQDPMIGPKPRNAFMIPDLPNWEALFHVPSGTIYVKTDKNRLHSIGTGNWSAIEFFNEPENIQELTPKIGRPPKVLSGAV